MNKLYTYLINIQGRPMEINNSYSQNSYQSKTSSTKAVDEVNNDGILNTFKRLIDKANTNNTDHDTKKKMIIGRDGVPIVCLIYSKGTIIAF
jgi:hypothetical protein